MTNPSSYTAVPNWLIDQASGLSGAAFKVAVTICRLTIGWQKEDDVIAIGRLMVLTGLCKTSVVGAIADLERVGIIEQIGAGPRGMGRYRLVQFLDRSIFCTGPFSVPVHESSTHEPAEPVQFLDRSDGRPVQKMDTQKKDLVTTNVVTAAVVENREPEHEPATVQPSLVGLPEPSPPSCAAPPAPTRPPRVRRENPPAARALYPAIFELCKSGQKGGKSMACRNLARDLSAEFQATPEQVGAFWDWFKTFSQAAQTAARERRPVNPPLPRQVYEAWPQYLVWYEAREAERRRQQEAAARRPSEPTPEERRAAGELARQLNPFRNRLSRPVVVATD